MGEVEHLQMLDSIARKAGMVVPRSRIVQAPGAYPAAIQTPLDGRPASALLISEQLTSTKLMDIITNWLIEWSRATQSLQPWSTGWLEQMIVVPARELAPC